MCSRCPSSVNVMRSKRSSKMTLFILLPSRGNVLTGRYSRQKLNLHATGMNITKEKRDGQTQTERLLSKIEFADGARPSQSPHAGVLRGARPRGCRLVQAIQFQGMPPVVEDGQFELSVKWRGGYRFPLPNWPTVSGQKRWRHRAWGLNTFGLIVQEPKQNRRRLLPPGHHVRANET